MRRLPHVTITPEVISLLPEGQPRKVLERAIEKHGRRLDTQTMMQISAGLAEHPSNWIYLSRALSKLATMHAIEWNPALGVSGPKRTVRPGRLIMDEEQARIMDVAKSTPLVYLLSAMWMTGMAFVDASLLQWSEVDVEEGVIEKTREKMATRRTGGRCIIPLDPGGEFLKLLRDRYPTREEYIGHYPSVNGAHYVDQWTAVRYLRGTRGQHDIRWMFAKICKAAGVEGVLFHDYRRTTATRLLQKLDPITTAQVTGHKSLTSLQQYIIPDRQDLTRKVRSIYVPQT